MDETGAAYQVSDESLRYLTTTAPKRLAMCAAPLRLHPRRRRHCADTGMSRSNVPTSISVGHNLKIGIWSGHESIPVSENIVRREQDCLVLHKRKISMKGVVEGGRC